MQKEIVYKVEEGMDRKKILCTTYQMRNFYDQMRDGFFTNLDIMNYIQHYAAAQMARKRNNIVDVCCGRSLMLPLLRYYAKNINSYTGIDISKKNLREAVRGAVKKDLTQSDIGAYYPFHVRWKCGNVSSMSGIIPEGFADFVIYTSAIEHMHKDDGYQSLVECKKIMGDSAVMFLSCPNTPGNGYNTQYKAHVYEWGYDELKEAFSRIGFEVMQEVGLVMGVRDMDKFYEKQPKPVQELYQKIKAYLPNPWLTVIMSIPFPEASKEILFVVRKKG